MPYFPTVRYSKTSVASRFCAQCNNFKWGKVVLHGEKTLALRPGFSIRSEIYLVRLFPIPVGSHYLIRYGSNLKEAPNKEE